MKEIFVEGDSLPQAYHRALAALYTAGVETDCPDYGQKQIEAAMTVHVKAPLQEPRVSKLIIGGAYDLKRYEIEMLDGDMDFMIGRGWDYTYHDRYARWMPQVLAELRRNPDSRRAVIAIRDNGLDFSGSDPACFQSMQFFIRGGRLDCAVLFRSNDLPEAFFFNAFALIQIQERAAAELGVEVGDYCHRSNSMHCYEKNFALLKQDYEAITTRPEADLCYSYRDFFKDLMDEEEPKVRALIADLKERYGDKAKRKNPLTVP